MNTFFLLITLALVGQLHAEKNACAAPTAKTIKTQTALEGITVKELKKHLQSGKPVLIDVYASWCGPCKHMLPIVEALAADSDLQDAIIIKINFDTDQDILKALAADIGQIKSVPSFFIFKNGKIVEKWNGGIAQDQLKKRIQKHL